MGGTDPSKRPAFVGGEGSFIIDPAGRRYLDFSSQLVFTNVGHQHPNNVGAVRLRLEGFLRLSDEDFEWAFQLNFFIALRATRAALAHMTEHGGGAIVNVASVNSFYHPDGAVIDYGAAKAALVNMTKALSQELGRRASA